MRRSTRGAESLELALYQLHYIASPPFTSEGIISARDTPCVIYLRRMTKVASEGLLPTSRREEQTQRGCEGVCVICVPHAVSRGVRRRARQPPSDAESRTVCLEVFTSAQLEYLPQSAHFAPLVYTDTDVLPRHAPRAALFDGAQTEPLVAYQQPRRSSSRIVVEASDGKSLDASFEQRRCTCARACAPL